MWRPPSPEAPIDPKWKDGWKDGYTAGFSAAMKHFVSSPRDNTPGTGSGGAEPESSEVVKKKKKSKKKLNWIEYTKADLDETPLFVVKLGEGEDEVQPYPEEFQKESYNYSTRT